MIRVSTNIFLLKFSSSIPPLKYFWIHAWYASRLFDWKLARIIDAKVYLLNSGFFNKHNRHGDQSATLLIFVRRTYLTLSDSLCYPLHSRYFHRTPALYIKKNTQAPVMMRGLGIPFNVLCKRDLLWYNICIWCYLLNWNVYW